MAMHPVPFQRGMSLTEFPDQYGTEEQCRQALERLVWPAGFRYPRCAHHRCTPVQQGRQRLHQCTACGHQASVRVGRICQASTLPLTT